MEIPFGAECIFTNCEMMDRGSDWLPEARDPPMCLLPALLTQVGRQCRPDGGGSALLRSRPGPLSPGPQGLLWREAVGRACVPQPRGAGAGDTLQAGEPGAIRPRVGEDLRKERSFASGVWEHRACRGWDVRQD